MVVPPPFSETVTHTLQFYSVDVAGNTEATKPVPVFAFSVSAPPVDATPPLTTCNAIASYTGTATISLSATDHAGGSGVAHTYYRVDGGAQQTGTTIIVPPPVSGSATHAIEFWSVDVAGNGEAPRGGATFTIAARPPDTTAPATSSNALAYYSGTATITLTAADDAGGSGVAHTYYILDGAAAVEGTTIVVPPPFGGTVSHTLQFYSVDEAGNVEATKPVPAHDFSVSAQGVPLTGTIIFRWDNPAWDAWARFYVDGELVADASQPGWDGWYIMAVPVRPLALPARSVLVGLGQLVRTAVDLRVRVRRHARHGRDVVVLSTRTDLPQRDR